MKQQRFVMRFRTLAKAKRAWDIFFLLSGCMKILPDDVWVYYSEDHPREITFGTGEPPTQSRVHIE